VSRRGGSLAIKECIHSERTHEGHILTKTTVFRNVPPFRLAVRYKGMCLLSSEVTEVTGPSEGLMITSLHGVISKMEFIFILPL
jgi:hypothetical protein